MRRRRGRRLEEVGVGKGMIRRVCIDGVGWDRFGWVLGLGLGFLDEN